MKKINLEGLVTKKIGCEIIYYKKIDSTQKEIWRRIIDGKIKIIKSNNSRNAYKIMYKDNQFITETME